MSTAGLRLGLGLLTILPAGQVQADRATARAAVLSAPLIGAALGGLAWVVGAALVAVGAGSLLAAVGAVATLAVVTRGLHLDGLADLADGLGSGRPAEGALEVMRRSDVGPFGVVTLVLVLLAQVAALEQAWDAHVAGPALVVAVATGRLAVVWACRAGVPGARSSGLGALVAGTVPALAAVLVSALLLAVCVGWGLLLGAPETVGLSAAAVAGTAAALLLLRRAVSRLGGVTGDVLGALVEVATTTALVVVVVVAG